MEYLNFWSGLLISAVCFAIFLCAICKAESERKKSSSSFRSEIKKPVIRKCQTRLAIRGNFYAYTCGLDGDKKCIAYGASPKEAYAKWFWMIYNKDTD